MKEITKEEKNWNDTSYEDTAKGHIGNGDTPVPSLYSITTTLTQSQQIMTWYEMSRTRARKKNSCER